MKLVIDPEHRRRVNALIPQAVNFADQTETSTISEWARVYLGKMNELTENAGLRVSLEVLLRVKEKHGY